jgi:hypothetical protein
MSCIIRNRPGMLRYGAAHYITDQMHTPGYCEQQIVNDCERSGITAKEFAQSKIILSFLDEGFGPNEIQPLTDTLLHSHPGRFMVLFNAHVDVDQLPYSARCFTAWLINRSEYRLDQLDYNFDIALDRKFLCLLRRPTLNRAHLARFFLDHIGLDTVRLSFGSGAQGGLDQYRNVVGQDLPLLVDGVLTDRVKEFDISNTLFHSCLFNIAAETSSQTEYNWRSVFLTEKTWKAVMQRQIPIWYGVPGLVKHVRSLGFDTFDDILGGHQYDAIMDETARHQSVFNLISQINNQYSLADCQTLRQQLQPRFEANFEQLLQYFRTNRRQVSNAILEFDYQTGLTALSK